MFKVIQPQSQEEFNSYFKLRYEVLRKPWGANEGSEKDNEENLSEHALIWDNKRGAIAVCRLQKIDDQLAQIRFMAVHPEFQGKGLGKLILQYMEEKAKEMGMLKIVLQARENAVPFYNASGYLLVKKTHVLFDKIQHYQMVKNLT